MPHIASIVYKPADLEKRPPDYYSRIPIDKAQLKVGYGIVGDTKGKSSVRQLNIMFSEEIAELTQNGFHTQPGELGEQIVVVGLQAEDLSPAKRLKFGESAIVELIELRTGCPRFEHIQGHAASEAAGRIGYMARVVADGEIAIGSPVEVAD